MFFSFSELRKECVEKVLGIGGDGVEGGCVIWQYIKGLFYFQTSHTTAAYGFWTKRKK